MQSHHLSRNPSRAAQDGSGTPHCPIRRRCRPATPAIGPAELTANRAGTRLVTVVFVLALGACSAPTGDFGRPRPSYLNDTVLPLVGREMARSRGEAVSDFALTDDEKELRARAYRLIMPIHRDALLGRAQAELVRTRIWPEAAHGVDPTLYYRKLRADGFVSSEARYNAIESEILADVLLVEPFYETARRVCEADTWRLAALSQTVAQTRAEEQDAFARIDENRRVMGWAVNGLRWRVESYSYALQRNRIEIPSPNDTSVEIALRWLASQVGELDAAMARFECPGRQGIASSFTPPPAAIVKG